MGTRFIHVDIKHGYNPIMICYARRLISQTCCASTVSTVGGCILSCRPLSSEDISLLMIKFLVFPIATTQDVVGVCLNRIGKVCSNLAYPVGCQSNGLVIMDEDGSPRLSDDASRVSAGFPE